MTEKDWYDNKSLFEMLQRHEKLLTENTHELKLTQIKMERYNGLIEKTAANEREIQGCKKEIQLMQATEAARVKQLRAIKGWVSVGISIISALVAWGVLR